MLSAADRRSLIVLLVSAVLLFSAGMDSISLQSLDDAFYARKGVEMGRQGHVYTVTVGGEPTFQNPPLQFWIMGRFFAVFGERDAIARLPIVLMALGTLLATVRLGARTVGGSAGVTGVALLLITPIFVSTARATMLEIPFGWWVTLAVLLFVEGVSDPARRRWVHPLMALPIGAAILTKSVLGVTALLVLPAVMIASRAIRDRCSAATIVGLVAGLAIGLSWPVHQWWFFGAEALRQHYLGQVLEPSTQGVGPRSILLGYPIILLRSFEPILWPGLAGAVMLGGRWWRHRHDREPPWHALLLVAWIALPIAIASFSSAQSSRYIFPILPAVALCGAWWLHQVLPRVAAFVTRAFAPALACLAAAIFWIAPQHLTRDQNRIIKREASALQRDIPADATVGYVGTRYWRVANPFLYYTDRPLTQLASAAALCEKKDIQFVFADKEEMGSLAQAVSQCGRRTETRLESAEWVLVRSSDR